MIKVENFNFKYGKIIGSGTFGTTFEGEIDGHQVVALKFQQNISEYEKNILRILKGKQFDHIIQIIAFEDKGKEGFYTLMELGKKFELKNLSDKKKICLQMAKGVSELHQLGFFHRDLKPDNFVISKDNKIKLIDFGTAKQIIHKNQTYKQGTFLYMAPEVFKTNDYDLSVDIWSLGMVFYEIFTNVTFFQEDLEMEEIIQISKYQINHQLHNQEKNNNINNWQKKLLEQMIVQRLINNKIDQSITRISINQVIAELEQVNELEEKDQQIIKQGSMTIKTTSNQNSTSHSSYLGSSLPSEDFDPRFNQRWDNFREKEQRGPPYHRYDYYFPKGCQGFGLNVKKYGDNQDWIKMDGNPNEWRIMYHGTTSLNPHSNDDCVDEFGNTAKVGQGIYLSNDFKVFIDKITQIGNRQFSVIFMSRVNPRKIRQSEAMKFKNQFVVNHSEDVRPYRILLYEHYK